MDTPARPQVRKASDITTALGTYDLPSIRRYQRSTRQPSLSHIPGDTGLPVLGHTYGFLTNLHKLLDKRYAQYGPVFRVQTPLLSAVMMLGPDANKRVFQNEDKIFSNFLAWDNTFHHLFDNNLLERDFNDHKTQRKILQQAFKRPAIEGHMAIMNPLLKAGVSDWGEKRTIRAMDTVKQLLLNTGAEVFLGLEMGEQAQRLNKAFTDIVAATADPFRRKEIWFSPYAKGVKASRLLTEYVMAAIPGRRDSTGSDMFSQLCRIRDDDGKLIADEVIRDHIIFVLFAAHDTTTSALSAVLYSLASDPAWQEELRQEMLSIDKEELEFDDVAKLVKTGWTFKEALRMHPALTMMPRYALEEFYFDGHRIPANTIVVVSALFTHYMPEYWSNPYQFDPHRFSPGREEEKQEFFQYIPFGGGAHKCLGMHFAEVQGKMFLFHLLKKYRVTKRAGMTQYKYNSVPLTFPTDGLPLRFTSL